MFPERSVEEFEKLLKRAKFLMVITVKGADYLLELKKESLKHA